MYLQDDVQPSLLLSPTESQQESYTPGEANFSHTIPEGTPAVPALPQNSPALPGGAIPEGAPAAPFPPALYGGASTPIAEEFLQPMEMGSNIEVYGQNLNLDPVLPADSLPQDQNSPTETFFHFQ